MIDERAFIAQAEAAGADEFAQILRTVDRDQERALRAWLGDAAFERMRNTALAQSLTRAAEVAKLGNVVVLHGILGGELSEGSSKIWANVLQLLLGRFMRLTMDAAGNSVNNILASGILKKYYGDLLLSLAKSWNVQYFAYDWRADITESADKLRDSIAQWFPNQPVHLVAHSMGGLVARSAIRRHPEMWRAMAPGRLVMLGTPNQGSLAIPMLFSGLNGTIKTVATVDLAHSQADLLRASENFPGAWQMLPSTAKLSGSEALYSAATYPGITASQPVLDRARQFVDDLSSTIDPPRMIYVAGYNQRTADGVTNLDRLDDFHSYTMTCLGDGTVPHSLGLLDGVTTYYVEEEHSKLPGNATVIQAMNGLLSSGTATGLLTSVPADCADAVRGNGVSDMQGASEAELNTHVAEVRALRDSLAVRGAASGLDSTIVTPEESRIQEYLFRGFSIDFDPGDGGGTGTPSAGQASPTDAGPGSPSTTPAAMAALRIHVKNCGISEIATGNTPTAPEPSSCGQELPVDAISVGHYAGVKPLYAELEVDKAISGIDAKNEEPNPPDLILTGFTERGTLPGQLGQTFVVADPRDHGAGPRRVFAIAGMGQIGRFGIPEAAAMARELCWSLARLGKRHLGTVLIGAGAKNLTVEDAVMGWMQGLQRAAAECSQGHGHCLEAITFAELDPERTEQLKRVLSDAVKKFSVAGWKVVLCDAPQEAAVPPKSAKQKTPVPTRITAELRDSVFRFGAMTENASIPERDVALNPNLVFDVNDLIAGERDPLKLSARGEFMRRLLIPRDLDGLLAGSAPIVLACDSDVARIHWELLSQPHPQGVLAGEDGNFLGLCRGFTRQLRTTFAPAPEPPPAPRRKLRALVIGDTASDMPLPGARAEALAVCRLLDQVNAKSDGSGNSVEVVPMIGPNEANWALVMERLLESPPFDILHYAGHCFYNPADPEASGWIFSDGNILSARELARVDNIPKFVFSNACESGITPSRSELRTAALAPSFAEAFFARGVANFVCTAWPVDDSAAQAFALRLYEGLLGLGGGAAPEAMHVAMREARRTIMNVRGGRSWGAYQHYGNPFFQLFR